MVIIRSHLLKTFFFDILLYRSQQTGNVEQEGEKYDRMRV